jgi:hypothetical protein
METRISFNDEDVDNTEDNTQFLETRIKKPVLEHCGIF